MVEKGSNIAKESKAKAKTTLAFINGFADDGSFVETDTLLAGVSPLGEAVGEGVVSGFACINGLQTAVFATNPDMLKGSIGEGAANKISRLVKSAVKIGAPLISVIDTSGARFGEGVAVLESYGKLLSCLADAYGAVPTVCVLKGNNFGMLSYMTAFSDLVIAFDKAVMATSSPLILASKTKEDAAKVGTAASHAAQSGMVALTVKTSAELKKTLTSYLDLITSPVSEPTDDLNRVSKSLKAGVKTQTLLKEIFDKDSVLELRAAYAPEAITALARLGGMTVGIVAGNAAVNEGKLTTNAAVKINELLTLCETHGLPVVNLVDCTGVVSDLEEERGALIREVGSMIYNYSQISVGKIALVVGSAIGAGYTAFCSNAVYDYTLAWQSAQVGVMPSEAAARLLYGEDIASAKDKAKAEAKFASAYAQENMSALATASLGLFDNVIKPQHSRSYLINAVQTFLSKR